MSILLFFDIILFSRGRSSVVEHLLSKQNVVGSSPIARSTFLLQTCILNLHMSYNWGNILSPQEKIQMEFSLSPRYLIIILCGSILLSIIVAFFSFIAAVFILLLGLLYWVYLRKAKRYCFTDKRIIMVDSFFGTSSISIDYTQITDIETDQSFFDRLGGWGTLTINTAGTNAPQTSISYVESPQQIKQRLDQIRDTKQPA